MLSYLAAMLVVAAIGALARSLLLKHRLVATLPKGGLRSQWCAMMALVVFFIAGFGLYLAFLSDMLDGVLSMIVPTIFFFGACFVWITARLALHTAESVRRLAFLEQENVTDPLTGVFNRRYLDKRLDEEISRARRFGTQLSVMLLDLDNFKKINDRFGHQTGDEVLAQFAKIVTKAVRQSDFVARYGGEEFVVIASYTGLSDSAMLAERLRASVEAGEFLPSTETGKTQSLEVTVSVGLASFNEEFDNVEKLLHAADGCLYQAKRLGRNRVAIAKTKDPAVANDLLVNAVSVA